MVMADNAVEGLEILLQEDVIKLLKQNSSVVDGIGMLLTRATEEAERSDLASLISGVVYFSTDSKKCRYFLEKVKLPCWKQYVMYFLALLEYKEGKYLESLTGLSSSENTDVPFSSQMKAFMAHLFGSCLSKLGKPHCAIQKYREALKCDFSFLLPLFHISLEYRKLGLTDAELESLNLLVTAMEDDKETMTHSDVPLILHLADIKENLLISLPQALYTMASRCMELERYDVASQHYLDILALLQGAVTVDIKGTELIPIPAVEKIYQELMFSLMKSEDNECCLSVCDHVLRCKAGDVSYYTQTQESLPASLPSQGFDGISRKRLRSVEGDDNSILVNDGVDCDLDLWTHVCKAEALISLRRIDEAVSIVDRIEAIVQDGALLLKQADTSHCHHNPEPLAKRRRISSDGDSILQPTNENKEYRKLTLTMADMYKHLGVVLSREKKYQDALHCIRISLQLNSASADSLYHCTKVLLEMDCQREALLGWAKSRNLDKADSFQIANMLKQRKSAISAQSSKGDDVDKVTEVMLLRMDVRCLEYLLQNGGKTSH